MEMFGHSAVLALANDQYRPAVALPRSYRWLQWRRLLLAARLRVISPDDIGA
jgi:hypothetical protein